MDITEAKEKISNLKEKLNFYAKKYYDDDAPVISDSEYDTLMSELKNLEKEFPDLITPDSLTQKVGGTVKKGFKEIVHEIPLQSLQDVFTFEELIEFDKKIQKKATELNNLTKYVVEAKVDGLSTSLKYENGIFIQGATRGNGNIGEEITENLKTIKHIPVQLVDKIDITIRGEVFISKKNFEKMNKEREEEGEPLFANSRNAAAGSLRQLDSNITSKRPLDIYIFNIQKIQDKNFNSHYEELCYLEKQGFNVIPIRILCESIDEAIKAVKEIGYQREGLEFAIDGAVIKVDNLSLREQLGSTSKAPRWAIAYKYPPEQKETIIKDIICNVGRTGAITPMAILEPVIVAGSKIAKTTLHNEDFIKEKDLRIGDYVIIQKAGDVIPEVVKSLKNKRTGKEKEFNMPQHCPVCGAQAIREQGESVTRCIGIECEARNLRNIIHFASKDAMDIKGLGEAIIEQLLNKGLINNIADIYKLKLEDIASLKKNGTKFAQNLINAIEKSKENDLYKLVTALGIRHVGVKAAKTLSKKFKTLDKLMNARFEQLSETEDVGEITIKSIIQFFEQEQTKDLINKLKIAGVNMNTMEVQTYDERFSGKTFVLTGSLEKHTREEASQIIEKFGGKTSNSVSKKTDYLLAGEESGSKLNKAQELGVLIISEQDFEKMINT